MKLHMMLTCVLGMGLLAGCGANGPLNANAIGNALGGPTGGLVKAGGHEINAMALSEKDEDAMGQSVGVILLDEYGLYKNDLAQEYVRLVGFTVASASPNPAGNYVFGVLDTTEVNAFSGPNGYVFITRGALENMKDEAELAGVLGHEIAHVCHHDGLHQVQAAEQQGALSEAIKAGTGDQQFAALADAGVDAITKTGYTQPQEFDADRDGVVFMSAAGYDPHSYLNFLQRLQAKESSTGVKLMSTHPGIADRVKKVADEIANMKSTGHATLADRFAKYISIAH